MKLRRKDEKREKDVFDKLQSDKEFLVEEITSLQNLLEEKLKDKTTTINHKLDKHKSSMMNIVEAFSRAKKDAFRTANVIYVLMKRVEAIEKQIHLVPTLTFDTVTMVEGQT